MAKTQQRKEPLNYNKYNLNVKSSLLFLCAQNTFYHDDDTT